MAPPFGATRPALRGLAGFKTWTGAVKSFAGCEKPLTFYSGRFKDGSKAFRNDDIMCLLVRWFFCADTRLWGGKNRSKGIFCVN